MRGIKVKGNASLVRSTSVPGLILSTNTEAAQAALSSRQRRENDQEIMEAQNIQIIQLQQQLKMVLEHVGLTSSPETDSEDEENA